MEYQGIPRSFAVEFAALGFLVEASMHGYELRERLSAGLGSLWRIASSQLYNVLHRLEKKGGIECHVELQSGRPSRNVVRITAIGERAFWGWAMSPVRHLRDVRVEFLAKVYFVRRLDPSRIPELIDAERRALHELGERLSERDAIASDDEPFGRLALSFRRCQIGAALAWLDEHDDALADVREENR